MYRLATFLAVFVVATAALAQPFSHQAFDAVLRAHVKEGEVDYPAIARDPKLSAYLERIKAVDVNSLGNKAEQLSFWINAYNALAIKGILNGGSPSTFFGRIGYFSGAVYEVGGRSVNLYDLERKIIIPMGEPRIHFAINCASVSCPALRSAIYDASALDLQLDTATRRFINDPARNRFDSAEKVAYLSKIFDWFDADFGGSDEAVLSYVSRYVDNPALVSSLGQDGWRIEYLDYDWNLNGRPPSS